MHTSTSRPTGSTPAEVKQCIKRIRSRLERWELPHLRELAARLSTELEEAQDRAYRAEQSLEFWQRHAHELQDQLRAEQPDVSICLTIDGDIHLLQGAAA